MEGNFNLQLQNMNNNNSSKENINNENISSQHNNLINFDKLLSDRENLCNIAKFLFKKIFESNINEQSFESLIELCHKNGKVFLDNLFPPNENSLIKGYIAGISNFSQLPKKWSKIKWLRASEFTDHPQVFPQDIESREIKQGALSDCYFLSVIAAIAEYPNRIRSLFVSDIVNPYGIFGVKICKDGEWRDIVIDDYFPCDNRKNVPCFSSGRDATLWVQILEKCYAKAYGSYYKIEMGLSEQTMRDLTGAPVVTYDNSSNELLPALKEAYERKWIITASAGETEASKELLKEVGLIPMHSYSIILVHSLHYESENNLMTLTTINTTNNMEYSGGGLPGDFNLKTLLKIRNPWGKNEWIGDWSDFSNLWRDDLKERLNYNENDGCFYMNLKDFKHYFSKIQICKVHEDYCYQSLRLIQKASSYCLVKLTVSGSEFIHAYVSLVQKDKKNYSMNDYKYGISRFIICKLSTENELKLGHNFPSDQSNIDDELESNIEYIIGKMGQEREIFEERHFEPGEYLIFTELDIPVNGSNNNCNTNNMPQYGNILTSTNTSASYLGCKFDNECSYVISVYSSAKIELTTVDNSLYPKILEKIYVSCAKKQNEVIRFINDGAPNCLKYTNTTSEGYAYIYFENNEDDATLIEDVKYTKFEGLRLLEPFSGTSYRVVVGPGKKKIVLIKQVELNGYNLIYSYHSNFQFSPKRLLQLTKTKGKKTLRKDPKLNIEVEIVVYTYKHSLGLCFYYENNTVDRKLEETLKITNKTGVEIVGGEERDNQILINLGPGERKFIELRALKNNWSVQSSVSYKIESL